MDIYIHDVTMVADQQLADISLGDRIRPSQGADTTEHFLFIKQKAVIQNIGN